MGRDARSGRTPPRRRAAANSRVIRRMSSAGTPLTCSARSGVNSATASATASALSTYAGGLVRPSSNSTCSIASSTTASVPGRTKWCSVGDLGGLGAARVEHHHPAAALLEVAQPVREVGHGHQRAVGGHRVGAEDQEVRRAVDVGDGQQELVAVQLPADELVRDLVDRRGAEPVAGAQALDEREPVGGRRRGRARSGCRGRRPAALRPCWLIAPASRSATRSSASSQRDLDPLGVRPLADPAHRAPQPVGVGVDVGERDALGADVAAGERVGVVAADRGDAVTLDGQLEPADRLAEVADAERGDGFRRRVATPASCHFHCHGGQGRLLGASANRIL